MRILYYTKRYSWGNACSQVDMVDFCYFWGHAPFLLLLVNFSLGELLQAHLGMELSIRVFTPLPKKSVLLIPIHTLVIQTLKFGFIFSEEPENCFGVWDNWPKFSWPWLKTLLIYFTCCVTYTFQWCLWKFMWEGKMTIAHWRMNFKRLIDALNCNLKVDS